MNIFKKEFWLMVGDAFKDRFHSSSFSAIIFLIFSLVISFPFLLIYSIFNLMGVISDA